MHAVNEDRYMHAAQDLYDEIRAMARFSENLSYKQDGILGDRMAADNNSSTHLVLRSVDMGVDEAWANELPIFKPLDAAR